MNASTRRSDPAGSTGWRLVVVAIVFAVSSSAVSAAQPQRPRHLIYLHGRIVQEQQNARPLHPQFGHYELARIVEVFRKAGFVVTADLRPRNQSVDEGADRVVDQVNGLLTAGVPAEDIVIVGASMGAAITFASAARLPHKGLRFAVLGTCLSTSLRSLAERGQVFAGRFLSVREASDEATAGCPPWRDASAQLPSAIRAREIVVNTGLNHGYIYRPIREWTTPIITWARDP
ncbi:MAG TPA: hypothetical protein VFL80_06785 [Thermoanaerobaculia bacterium]|nr:hypothetical protein [Thermoanaerobaculia bacterium]